MYQELYQYAMRFAAEKHYDQKVPGTQANYILHIANVAMEVMAAYQYVPNFDIHFALQVAILHDTLEDTDTTFEELIDVFGQRIAEAVLALTKNTELPKDQQMKDSLRRINMLEDEVGIVKIADRITNLQKPPSYWGTTKRKHYQEQARVIAENLQGKNGYLHKRLTQQIIKYKQYIYE